jgi:general L-amino acid transport system permease protein
VVAAASNDPDWIGYATEGYIFIALMFWIFCFGMSRYSQHLERLLHTGHGGRN